MKKKTLFAIFLIFSVISASLAFQGAGAETIVIRSFGKYKDVPLPHHKHQLVLDDCTSCHNLFPQEAGIIDNLKESGKLAGKDVMNQCVACHKERRKANMKTGPSRCKACHTG